MLGTSLRRPVYGRGKPRPGWPSAALTVPLPPSHQSRPPPLPGPGGRRRLCGNHGLPASSSRLRLRARRAWSARSSQEKGRAHTQGKRRKGARLCLWPFAQQPCSWWRHARRSIDGGRRSASRHPPPDGRGAPGDPPVPAWDWKAVPPRRCAHAANRGEAKQAAAAGGGELERCGGRHRHRQREERERDNVTRAGRQGDINGVI